MTHEQLIAQLKDIHAPNPILMWPLTIGWYFAGAIGLLAIIYVFYRLIRTFQKKHWQKPVLRQLHAIEQIQQDDSRQSLAELSVLLRRIALYKYGRTRVAGLTNHAWLEFLDQEMKTDFFTRREGALMATAPYQKNIRMDLTPFILHVKKWIKRDISHV